MLPDGGNSRVAALCGAPVLAVCGFSGSGKTTLLEAALPQLVARGLSVAVVKHDAHGFNVDREGKDSDRLFRAGATIALRGPQEQFQRRGSAASLTLEATLADFARDHDLLLVEGHKDTPLPKLWLAGKEESAPPANVRNIESILPWDTDRLSRFMAFVDRWLPTAWNARALYLGFSMGEHRAKAQAPGGSRDAEARLKSLAELLPFPDIDSPQVAILGSTGRQIPPGTTRLPAPPDLDLCPEADSSNGARRLIANLLAAHHWAPRAAWIVIASKHAELAKSATRWLSSLRRPGTWAAVPRSSNGQLSFSFALYEPQALALIDRLVLGANNHAALLEELSVHPRTVTPDLPEEFSI